MKNIKIFVVLGLSFLLVSCGYNLPNKPVPTSKNRDYSKKTNYGSVGEKKEIKQIQDKAVKEEQ